MASYIYLSCCTNCLYIYTSIEFILTYNFRHALGRDGGGDIESAGTEMGWEVKEAGRKCKSTVTLRGAYNI